MAAGVLKTLGRKIPMTTVDLGHAAAIALAANDPLVAIAAQQPFRQGESVGRPAPDWVALPDLAVTASNVVECFQTVWRAPAPQEVLRRLRLVSVKASDQHPF